MVEAKYYRIAAESVLVIALIVSIGMNLSEKEQVIISPDGECPVDNTPYNSCNSCCGSDTQEPIKCEPGSTEIPEEKECIKYYGGSGGSCNHDHPACPEAILVDCGRVDVIAYTDHGKYFCDDIGVDANCIKADDLSMPFG